ncbi:hypothetical protein [Paracraurococcus ruber]|uniref:MarR family transcriptional regulator n=1 Tax=Paracraurococcus ruber TaxID=77675 RepID=A0ABS1CTI3_9PROT|nr:hypothetical protein [Paracraurococcus ruber]MBK1657791.1 hypothetical protein [Paracraurococcus ruber]TDG26982.1 hypothetical protein E2C05_24465 [Paracraurococcus ruber]
MPTETHAGPDTIPGLTDIAGLSQALLEHIPELAAECVTDLALDALCDLEVRTMRDLATAAATTPGEIARKVGVLVARLVDDGAEVELPDGEAALLRSVLRDLTHFAGPTASGDACRKGF